MNAFRVQAWFGAHLSNRRADGSPLSLVDRAVLLPLGHLSGHEHRYVTISQLHELTGMSADLIVDVLTEAVERGEVTTEADRYWPVQEAQEVPLDPAAQERRELELSIACGTCGAYQGDTCTTNKGRDSWASHLPRRDFANKQMSRQRIGA